jgi:sec-independent protein translocase protein TatC
VTPPDVISQLLLAAPLLLLYEISLWLMQPLKRELDQAAEAPAETPAETPATTE